MHLKNLLIDFFELIVITSLLTILVVFFDEIFYHFEAAFIPYATLTLAGLIVSLTIYFRKKNVKKFFTQKIGFTKGLFIATLVAIIIFGFMIQTIQSTRLRVIGFGEEGETCFMLQGALTRIEKMHECRVLDGTVCCPRRVTGETSDLLHVVCSLNPNKCDLLNATIGKFLYYWGESGREEYRIFASNILMGEFLNTIDDIGRERWQFAVIPSMITIAVSLVLFVRKVREDGKEK